MKTRILLIGNSYSEDMMMYLPELALDNKIEMEIVGLGYPGCSMDQNIDFITNKKKEFILRRYNFEKHFWESERYVDAGDVIASQDWDYISIQQCSWMTGADKGLEKVDELLSLVKSKATSPNTKYIWHMTWPYSSDCDFPVFKDFYNADRNVMYNKIVENVRTYVLPGNKFDLIIPSGTAVVNANLKIKNYEMYRDPIHLTYQLGRFVASLTAMRVLFGELSSYDFEPMGTNPYKKALLIEASKNAIEHPFEITESRLNEKDYPSF